MKSPLELAYHEIVQIFLSFDHPADFAIFLNDNPDILHFDVDAELVEWEPSMFLDLFEKCVYTLCKQIC